MAGYTGYGVFSDGYSQFNLESIVTLKQVSKGYQFLSNEIIWDYHGAYKEDAKAPTAEAPALRDIGIQNGG